MKRLTYSLLTLVTALGLVMAPLRVYSQEGELDNLFEDADESGEMGNQIPPPPPPPPPGDNSQNFGNPGAQGGDFGNPAGGTTGGAGSNTFGANKGGGTHLKTTNNPAPARQKAAKLQPQMPKAVPPISTAGPEDITNANYPDLIESFDYPNAEIGDVVKAISELTGKNFIVDPGVRGKITIMAPTQITVAEAYKAFLSALSINGFTVVPSGKFLKIVPTRTAARSAIETYSGAYYPNADVMITRIVKLKHISAEEVNKNLRFLPTKDGEMNPYTPTNSLIITDYGSNIDRIMKILNELDQAGFEEQMVVIPIRHAHAKDLADLIMQIINKQPKGSNNSNGFNAGVPRFPGAGGTRGSNGMPEELSLVAPDDRTNAIIVVGNKTGVEKIQVLVHKLDYKLDPSESGGVYVYYVKYGEAKKIATTFQGIASSSGTAGTGGAGGASGSASLSPGFRSFVPPAEQHSVFGGDVRVTADETNNSLVITASKQDYEVVLSLLQKIDIPRDQVYIETYIVEMNAKRIRNWQVNVVKFQPGANDATSGFPSAGPKTGFLGSDSTTLANMLSPTGGQGAIIGFGSGQKVSLKVGDSTIVIPSLLALINFLVTTTNTNVLSTPQILALDNEESTIEVGTRVATSKDTSNLNGVSTTKTNFEDATIKMTITPYISPESEDIRLKIDQSLKQAVKDPNALPDTVNLDTRAIKTNIVIANGNTAVLGGLIKDQETTIETKVPLLGDIPVLGWLFRSSNVQKDKLNLMVFLSPKIIRNSSDHTNLLTQKRAERVDWLKRNNDGKDPFGETIGGFPSGVKGTSAPSSRASSSDPSVPSGAGSGSGGTQQR